MVFTIANLQKVGELKPRCQADFVAALVRLLLATVVRWFGDNTDHRQVPARVSKGKEMNRDRGELVQKYTLPLHFKIRSSGL